MSHLFRLSTVAGVVATIAILAPGAEAARVRGSISDLELKVTGRMLGFTRTRVAAPVKSATRRKQAVALFLAVKDGESLPIPMPTKHQIITIEGLQFMPDIASCASDAQVSFVNADRDPITLTIDGAELGSIAPGAQKTYPCSPGEPVRIIRAVEWPHMRAMVYVGEVGVAALPDRWGRFNIDAPRGVYELRVLTRDGVLKTREVEVERRDVDLGKLDLAKSDSQAGDQPGNE